MNDSHTITQFKNGTAAELAAANPILAKAEMVLETDTNKFKFGDGETRYNLLPYAGGGSAGQFKYGMYLLSAIQPSNFNPNDHIEFDVSYGSLGGLSTGTGQEKGIVTLAAGKTYRISGVIALWFNSSAGFAYLQLYNRTTGSFIPGPQSYNLNVEYSATQVASPAFFGIVKADVETQIDLRFNQYSACVSGARCLDSYLLIEEYGGI